MFLATVIYKNLFWPQPKLGSGWDFVADATRYPVFKMTYDHSQMTNDQEYLIPDCMVSESVKEASYMDDTVIIENSMKYSSLTSNSGSGSSSGLFGKKRFLGGIISGIVGLFTGAFGSSGSQSNYYKGMMEEQRSSKTITTSTRYNEHAYTILLSTRCELHDNFKAWVSDIADALEFEDFNKVKVNSARKNNNPARKVLITRDLLMMKHEKYTNSSKY